MRVSEVGRDASRRRVKGDNEVRGGHHRWNRFEADSSARFVLRAWGGNRREGQSGAGGWKRAESAFKQVQQLMTDYDA